MKRSLSRTDMWSQKKGESTKRYPKALKADFNVLLHDNSVKLFCSPTVKSLGISEVSMLNGFLIQFFASPLTAKYWRNCCHSEIHCAMMLFLTIESWILTASISHVFYGTINWLVFQHYVPPLQCFWNIQNFRAYIHRKGGHLVVVFSVCSLSQQ